ncbi:uncharacterized protein N7483_007469 [Penicillium malachiteum]|uniref:uncharacterized protein n=1 Tax=Penicillium malachiteum TaxID=1324776 RepID=UPI00254718E7|nr:uncharacterized protein N7483_007469 [Penicillium malachiteum]KAJ5726112.1 hypothetical protein N7483_007469 [Penicillium malachiteum]
MGVEFLENLTKPLMISGVSTPWNHSRSLEYQNLDKSAPLKGYKDATWSFPGLSFWRDRDEWGKVRKCPWIAGAVLVLNIILALAAVGVGYSKEVNKGEFEMVELYEGSCNTSSRIATILHLVINILSTVLLGASNYTMQCLGAPSRADVDRAHQKHNWLDIGTFSVRNLGIMNWKRRILWAFLLSTSVPIHMLYNSVVFRSISAMEFGVLIVPDDLSSSESLVNDSVAEVTFQRDIGTSARDIQAEIFNGTFYNATLLECIEKYDINLEDTWNTELSTLVLTAHRRFFDNASSLGGSVADIKYFDDSTSLAQIKEDMNKASWDKTSWKPIARFWSYRVWKFTSPGGTIFSLTGGDMVHSLFEGESEIAFDRHTLHKYLYDKNPSATSLRTYLDTPSHWENSTWAGGISFTLMGYKQTSGDHVVVPVNGCKYKKATERCRILFSPLIAIIVVGCNVVKVICMVFAARMSRTGLLLTVGDSVASFLTHPDPMTKGRCLLSQFNVAKGTKPWSRRKRMCDFCFAPSLFLKRSSDSESDMEIHLVDKPPNGTDASSPIVFPSLLSPKRKRWCQAATGQRWLVTFTCVALCDMTFITLFVGIIFADDLFRLKSASAFFAEIWSEGFGLVSEMTLIPLQWLSGNTLTMILISNLPQFFLSIMYFLTNGLLTCMLGAAEWDRYAFQRRPLRVSRPRGAQRSTFYLTLPYRYGVPNLILFALIHWVVSEAFFFIDVQSQNVHNIPIESNSRRGCSISPLAVFIAILLIFVGWVTLVLLGLKKFKTHAPIVAHCSAAISASCHPPPDDAYAAFKPVMWGEVTQAGHMPEEENWTDCDLSEEQTELRAIDGLGLGSMQYLFAHCSLTSKEVSTPRLDNLYC